MSLTTDNLPPIIREAVHRFQREGRKGISWVWMWAKEQARRDVDLWLIEVKHPLAYEPGTQEQRFDSIVRELAAKEVAS